MPLDDDYTKAVVFVVGWREDRHGNPVKQALGTGFVVSVPAAMPGFFAYVVTAAHGVRGAGETWVRMNTEDGGVVDQPVAEWYCHDTADVSVAPLTDLRGISYVHVPEAAFIDRFGHQPKLGDSVYFIGLLANMAEMAEANVPMVRSGTLGRWIQERVPVRMGDMTTLLTAHLIDCRSYGGFSGSPCFVQFTFLKMVTEPSIPGGAIGNLEHTATLLLGLVSGHWDDWHPARTTGDILGTVESVVNTGVGIVTPADAIRETLNRGELVEQRQRANEDTSQRLAGGE